MSSLWKRSYEDSSESEEEMKKGRYDDLSSGEEKEECEEEAEVERDVSGSAENATEPAVPGKWSREDSRQLLISIMMLLPLNDVNPYSEQEAQIDWQKVMFGSFTADQCRGHWNELSKKLRRYRTMSDLVADALSLLTHLSSSSQTIVKHNQMMNSMPKSSKKKSSLPKIPMNAFSLFVQETMKNIGHIPTTERMKHIGQLYKDLSEEEKMGLQERLEELKRNHVKVLMKFREDNPELASEVDTQIMKLNKTPQKSRKALSSVVKHNHSILKYMNTEKTTPAKTVGGSKLEQVDLSSGGAPKKSASKPHSTKAAEEISHVSDSTDNEEEKYINKEKKKTPIQTVRGSKEEQSDLSGGGSPIKNKSPMKSASRSHKSKAAEEDRYVSDPSDNEEEEEEQKSKPPKKSHSAVPTAVSPQKPAPSEVKEKKKKVKVVTGLSQFVAAKIESYRQIHPEMSDKEIAMKLAGKWEKLSDKKKNKYEKLALEKMSSKELD